MIEIAERTIECFAGNKIGVPEELQILPSDAELDFVMLAAMAAQVDSEIEASDMRCFRVMTPKDGDKRLVWCRRIIDEIKAAKKMFIDLITEGMVPYRVGVDGVASAEVMDEFDPTAEEVIFMPIKAVVGG